MSKYFKTSASKFIGIVGFAALFYVNGALATTSEEFVAEAETYLEKGEVNAAIIQLKNALQENPDNARARLLLGLTYVNLNQGAAAGKRTASRPQAGC